METLNKFSPYDLLPIKEPLHNKESKMFFYTKVVKPLVKDIVRICNNGTPIDFNRIKELDNQITEILNNNTNKLANNKLIKRYLHSKNKDCITNLVYNVKREFVSIDDFNKEMELDYYANKLIRSSIINVYLKNINREEYCLVEWTWKDIKKLNILICSNFINRFIDKKVNRDNEFVINGINNFISNKVKEYNRKKAIKIKNTILKLKKDSIFNPNSAKQKIELFNMLGIEIEEKTKSGNDSTNKAEIERIYKEYKELYNNDLNNDLYKDILEILEILQDQSSASIIKNTFIKSFYNHSYNSVLYSNLLLFGAKSFRCTSNSPKLYWAS